MSEISGAYVSMYLSVCLPICPYTHGMPYTRNTGKWVKSLARMHMSCHWRVCTERERERERFIRNKWRVCTGTYAHAWRVCTWLACMHTPCCCGLCNIHRCVCLYVCLCMAPYMYIHTWYAIYIVNMWASVSRLRTFSPCPSCWGYCALSRSFSLPLSELSTPSADAICL